MSQPEPRRPFVVGDWTVRPSRLRLEREDAVVEVEPKVMEVLVHLAARPGHVHTRRELLDALWPEVVVGDEALTRAVYELRKALGDSSRDPRYVETIPKMGYRLVAEVRDTEPADEPAVARPPLDAETSMAPRRAARVALPVALVALLLATGLFAWTLLRPSDEPTTAPGTILRVTTDPGIERTPAVSPDGERIAYETLLSDGRSRLLVRDLDEGPPLTLASGPGRSHSPAWSPDGDRIAFLRVDGETCRVLAIPALGGPEETIAECAGAALNSLYHHLSWSPDGRWLAFADGPPNTDGARIQLVELATGARRALALPAGSEDGAAMVPRFSPSGDRLAFMRYADGISDLVVAGFEDGALADPRTVATGLNNVDGIAWSRNGRRIVFASDRSGAFALYRLAIEDGLVEPLGVGTDVRRPTAVPGRDLVVYESWTFDLDLWAIEDGVDPDGPLVDSTQRDVQPALSPDGRRIAFISTRSGRNEVWIVESEGGEARPVTRLESQGMVMPRWSPDGSRLVVGAQIGVGQDPGADLWVIDDLDGPARRLTDWPGHEIVGSWSEDGRWIYFGARREENWEIWRIPVGGGRPVQVTDAGGYVGRVADGRLWYTKHGRNGLWSRPAEGGPERRVTASFPSWDLFWTVGEGAAWRITRAPDDHLARLDLETGTWSRAVDLPDDVAPGFHYDPATGRVYVARDAGSGSDLRAAPF